MMSGKFDPKLTLVSFLYSQMAVQMAAQMAILLEPSSKITQGKFHFLVRDRHRLAPGGRGKISHPVLFENTVSIAVGEHPLIWPVQGTQQGEVDIIYEY